MCVSHTGSVCPKWVVGCAKDQSVWAEGGGGGAGGGGGMKNIPIHARPDNRFSPV